MLHLLRKKQQIKQTSRRGHHHVIDYVAEGNAFLSGLALYPQLINAVRTKDVQALSLATFLLLGTANVIWILYGIHRRDPAVIISSCLVIVAAGSLSALTILWG